MKYVITTSPQIRSKTSLSSNATKFPGWSVRGDMAVQNRSSCLQRLNDRKAEIVIICLERRWELVTSRRMKFVAMITTRSAIMIPEKRTDGRAAPLNTRTDKKIIPARTQKK